MMRHLGINIQTTVNKVEILEKLKANRDKHAGLVKEAREGYKKEAIKALKSKLKAIEEKGRVKSLSFNLRLPQDHTSAYNTVIAMLEAHTEDTITLSGSEFRMFVQDEWDWKDDFLTSNAIYSVGTQMLLGGDDEED